MINIVTKKEFDPTTEFSGIWFNEKSGAIFIWAGKPVCIAHSQDGRMVRADVFDMEFRHNPKKNQQKYSYEYPYGGFPMSVIARINHNGFEGGALSVWFGGKYGEVDGDGDWVLSQTGNIKLGEKIKIACEPTKGSLEATIIVLTYE